MINNSLAFGMPGGFEWIFIVFIFFGIPVLFVRYIVRSNKERRRLRLEVGKLADELEKMRKQAKGDEEDNPSDKSG